MANLLPNKIKQELKNSFLVRKLVLVGLAFGLLLVVTLIIISSILIYLLIRTDGTADLVPVTTTTTVRSGIDVEKIKNQSEVITSYWSESLISVIVDKVLTAKPVELKISSLVIERGEIDQPTKISVIGLVNSRDDLVGYVNLLRQDKFFSRVDLPVESLISDQGGNFIINLEK